jgi:hypothetical protein
MPAVVRSRSMARSMQGYVCRAHPHLCCDGVINVFQLLDQVIDAIYHLRSRGSTAWHSMEG